MAEQGKGGLGCVEHQGYLRECGLGPQALLA